MQKIIIEKVFQKFASHVGYIEQEIIDVNEANVFGDTLLHLASFVGDIESMKILIESGAELDFKGDLGYTPLHLAVLGNRYDAVLLLMQSGSHIEIKNDFDELPIETANALDFIELARLLRSTLQDETSIRQLNLDAVERIRDFTSLHEGNFDSD